MQCSFGIPCDVNVSQKVVSSNKLNPKKLKKNVVTLRGSVWLCHKQTLVSGSVPAIARS